MARSTYIATLTVRLLQTGPLCECSDEVGIILSYTFIPTPIWPRPFQCLKMTKIQGYVAFDIS